MTTCIKLTDIETPQENTTQAAWIEYLRDMQTHRRYVTVMHAADAHFPYHDQRALDLFFQLVDYMQPQVIVVGSDAFDFALLSKFDPDPSLNEGTTDVLDEIRMQWNPFIQELKRRAPQARLPFILGNHDVRIFRNLEQSAPKVRHTVWNVFTEIVRAGGLVDWLGETDAVRIGSLLVEHGNRTGVNAAGQLLADTGHQVSVMAGHIHKLTNAFKQGEDFAVQACTSGCLCAIQPHYARRARMTVKWQYGTAIGEVDLQSRDVQLTNLRFDVAENGKLQTRHERRTFESA